MAIPLPPGTKLKVGIWIGDTKCWAECEVAYSTPGFGTGVKFNRISESDLEQIRQFLGTLAPFAKKPTDEQSAYQDPRRTSEEAPAKGPESPREPPDTRSPA